MKKQLFESRNKSMETTQIPNLTLQFTFGDKGEAHLLDESVLPVTEKERKGEGKSSMGPRMKYGHAIMTS